MGKVHASDIYGSLYQTLEPKRFTDDPPKPLYLAMGLAWEQYLEKALVQAGVNAERPDAIETAEGVLFSPDLIVFNGDNRVGEIKLTFMGVSQDLSEPKFDKWLTQVKFYCEAMEIPRAVFYVLFVNGDYKKNREPVLWKYLVEFTKQELGENYQMLMRHARQMGVL